jgi:hypothetical protein
MGCSKGKKSKKPKSGRYECKKCGVVMSRKKDVCKAKKIS